MAIIVGGDPIAEKVSPVEAPESKENRDAEPAGVRKDGAAQSERPVKKPRKRKSKDEQE